MVDRVLLIAVGDNHLSPEGEIDEQSLASQHHWAGDKNGSLLVRCTAGWWAAMQLGQYGNLDCMKRNVLIVLLTFFSIAVSDDRHGSTINLVVGRNPVIHWSLWFPAGQQLWCYFCYLTGNYNHFCISATENKVDIMCESFLSWYICSIFHSMLFVCGVSPLVTHLGIHWTWKQLNLHPGLSTENRLIQDVLTENSSEEPDHGTFSCSWTCYKWRKENEHWNLLSGKL